MICQTYHGRVPRDDSEINKADISDRGMSTHMQVRPAGRLRLLPRLILPLGHSHLNNGVARAA